MRKILARAAVIVAAAALSAVALISPASAAGAAQIPGTEANTYIVQEQTVTDAGGQDFKITVRWDETYRTASGNIRVTVPFVKINAIGVDEDRDAAGDGGVDATIKSYNGYADGHVKLIQTISINGGNDPVQVNPANPLNRPATSKITVGGVGVDDDGYAGAATVTFVQPVIGDEDPGADGPGVEL
jgi:opacity protein-like surface antigen